MPIEHMSGRALDVLTKKGLATVYDRKKTGGLGTEIFFAVFHCDAATEPLMTAWGIRTRDDYKS